MATWSLGHLLLPLKSQISKTPRGKGRVLLWLKTKTSRTPRGKCHLLLLSKTFICILVQSNQSSCPAQIGLILHSSRFMRLIRIVRLVAFFVFWWKVQNIYKNTCRQMFKALEPFRKEVVVDEPSKDNTVAVLKFFSYHKKYQHQEPLKDLGIPDMTIEEFWEDGDKTSPCKVDVALEEVTRLVLSCRCMWLAIYRRSYS
jgi:hypothetical protein